VRNLHLLDGYRLTGRDLPKHLRGFSGDHTCGAFLIPSKVDGGALRIIAASELGWDHVSVSRVNRCPNWLEMCQVKELFFHDHETVMQLHVPSSDRINDHQFCLHLWRPTAADIPRPPSWMVGGCSPEEAEAQMRAFIAAQ
jgi:hypothetical protein